jgi:hypothetical protein
MALPSSSQSMNPIANAPPMDFAEKKGREAAVGGKLNNRIYLERDWNSRRDPDI